MGRMRDTVAMPDPKPIEVMERLPLISVGLGSDQRRARYAFCYVRILLISFKLVIKEQSQGRSQDEEAQEEVNEAEFIGKLGCMKDRVREAVSSIRQGEKR